MLTRLRVDGFKNLVDIDVRFGPFTCIAGPNGVGKSNLFDAILFLRDLAEHPFAEAAANVRGGEDDIELLFTPGAETMRFVAEMLIPRDGVDEFGQQASAASTFVEYRVVLGLRLAANGAGAEIELREESLVYVLKRDAKKRLGFPNSGVWFDSVIRQNRFGKAFISTDRAVGKVMRHQDQLPAQGKKSSAGRPLEYPLATLPRTVLSSARNAQECRTAVLVRREMQGWHVLQLEPSAMRAPDGFGSHDHIASNGAHLPATLYRLTTASGIRDDDQDSNFAGNAVLTRLANRLSELVSRVASIRVTRDDQRRLYRLLMEEDDHSEWPAASLSDGTLRFLALALVEEDPQETGVICMEEPENGVHPARIEAMLSLLQDIAVDSSCAAGYDNPLRQVIINTHSPVVAGLVEETDLLFAQPLERRAIAEKSSASANRARVTVAFRGIEGTWRSKVEGAPRSIALGDVLSYLLPSCSYEIDEPTTDAARKRSVREYARERQLELELAASRHESD